MKKRLFTLALALALCLGLCTPALANDMGKAGERSIISVGRYCSGFVDASGTLWMWGWNLYSQLGNGDRGDVQAVPIKVLDNVASVSCGVYVTGAIKTDGTLWMWGDNSYGQLGNGTVNSSPVPVKVLDNVAAVSYGENHTAAIKTDGTLWMWGSNYNGQLGNGTTNASMVPVKVLDSVAAVSCGYDDYTAAIKTDGTLWMWGRNSRGGLGNGTTTGSKVPIKVMDNVAAVSCGFEHTGAIKTDGTLWMWGYNYKGQLGNGTTTNDSLVPVKVLDNVAAVSCGNEETAAIKTDGTLLMWGGNDDGQLGNGTLTDSSTPVTVMHGVTAVRCAVVGTMTAAVKADGSLWTWGSSSNSQLGNGGTGNATGRSDLCQTVPVQITGLTAPLSARLQLNGGTGGGQLWTNADGTITVPTNPTKAGYTFGGWYTDEALTKPWNFNSKVSSGLALYARWVPVSSNATTTDKSTQTISLDGKSVTLDAYTLIADNGGDVTYVKLRDIAALLDGTSSQFDVDWRSKTIYIETGSPYIHRAGSELQTIRGTDGTFHWNTAPILIDGITSPLEGIVITDGNDGDHTFFKLRDLGEAIGFSVAWSAERGIYIETE